MKKNQMCKSLVTDLPKSDRGRYQSTIIKSVERIYPTRLTDKQYARCWEAAEAFLRVHGSIRNKQLRETAKIGYDQAIFFFKRATDEKRLVRRGVASGTHYLLKDESCSAG